jgi:hypothetical protein
MPRLLISYDLLDPAHTVATRNALYAEFARLGAVQIQKTLWIATTEFSVTYVTAALRVHFGPEDRFLVAGIDDIKSRRGINQVPRLKGSLRSTKRSRRSTPTGSRVSTSMSEKGQYKNRVELLQGTLDMLIFQTLQWISLGDPLRVGFPPYRPSHRGYPADNCPTQEKAQKVDLADEVLS